MAFLPVFYSHLALNDVPTLAPLCLALWGAAGVLRTGRGLDYLIAGIGIGLAAATKYTGGIVLLALLAAFGAHAMRNRGAALRGLLLAGVMALAAFFVAFPYAIIDHHAFLDGLSHQSDASREAAGKLGVTQDNGWIYYLWSFGWGLGWAPLVAAGVALPLLAVPAPLGAPGVPRPGADPLRRLHGLAGALLRALAHAGAAVRLPARRDLRRDPRDRGDAPGSGAAPDARRARGDRALRAGARLLRARRAGAVA